MTNRALNALVILIFIMVTLMFINTIRKEFAVSTNTSDAKMKLNTDKSELDWRSGRAR